MLYSNVKNFNSKDYSFASKAIQILSETDFNEIEDGRIVVDEDTYIQVLSYETENVDQVEFERHHNRLDIHYMVAGKEIIYLSSLTDLKPVSDYISERDIEFLEKPTHINEIILKKGDFLIIGMDEPHKTNGWINETPEFVKKVVIKTTRK